MTEEVTVMRPEKGSFASGAGHLFVPEATADARAPHGAWRRCPGTSFRAA